MRPINYQITNPLINRLIEIERLSIQIKMTDKEEGVVLKMRQNLQVQNIFHMGHLLGANISLKDASKFIQGKIENEELPFIVLKNFRNALEYIRSNESNNYIDLNNNFILHLNRLLINGWKEDWEAKIRTDDQMDATFDDWLLLFDPNIGPLTIEKELLNSYDWYKNNITRINIFIRVPVLIYRFIQLMPFKYLNKLTIISILDFILQKGGYVTTNYLSIAKIFDRNNEKYLELWKKAIESPSGNITYWLEAFTEDVVIELTEVANSLNQIKENLNKSVSKPFLNLNKRQLKILRYLQTIPSVKREDYVQMFDVSTMTAFRDLNELLKRKLLRIDGKGRATKYYLANR